MDEAIVHRNIGMVYDEFQRKAIEHIESGHSVIVSAPTGAGKTVIAEYVICDCLARDTKVIYTAPIKALSNQKFRDFQETFAGKIGILTGDVSINPHAPVLIMTTEIFRNKLLEGAGGLEDYSWIIFDEIHYLDDYERGTVWEESLIFLPEQMKLLGLSATIPNIDELAEWFKSIHKKPIWVIKEDKRPVPLHFFYQCKGEIVDRIRKIDNRRYKARPNKPTALIKHISDKDRLPCIYFSFGRRRCEYLAQEMTHFDFTSEGEKEEIRELFASLCERFGLTGEKSASMMEPLILRGIAYHHAGMLPTLKEVIERLFTSRLIKVIFTTETFALGINMPARSVIFDELRKFYGRFFSNLRTRDFYQMAGRAGRRGIDEEGFVYSRVNLRFISFRELKSIIYGEPERVKSRFNASYATIINLYGRYGEKLYDIYPLSFHHFQQKERFRRRALERMRSRVNILKEMGHIEGDAVTPKGEFAGKVFGYELPLAELYEQRALEELSETELGALCLALVYEPRKGSHRPSLTKTARRLKDVTDGLMEDILKKEKQHGITPLTKNCFFHLSPALEAWMKGASFDEMMRHTEADEGEIIRYFRMCIQILREILDTPAPEELKEKTKRATELINRDLIDAERQLRI
jgi:superfamily II RNA helicase